MMRAKKKNRKGGKKNQGRILKKLRSFVRTELTGCRCHLWHRRAVCRHVRPPHGATGTQKIQKGQGESKRR